MNATAQDYSVQAIEANSLMKELRRVPIFASLFETSDAEDAPSLPFLAEGEVLVLEAGQRVVNEGDDSAFCIVLESELRVLKEDSGQEMLLTTHQVGTFFG